MTHHTFHVVIREVEHAGRQITADVVRNDGRIVRSGLWPDYAEADCALLNACCALLNACCAEGWTSRQYHAARPARMAALRA